MKFFSLRLPLSLAAVALLGVGCGAATDDTQPQIELSDDEKIDAEIGNLSSQTQWDDVKKVLNKYKDINLATADGYIPVSGCEVLPGTGAMGIHYLNPGLAQDLVNDPYKPEVLLYVPDDTGALQLIGSEYFQADVGQERPTIIGEPFNGPMPGHNPQMPVHYDLHVWLFKFNPDGLFAQWNPNVKCP